jgi:hypothetical protein
MRRRQILQQKKEQPVTEVKAQPKRKPPKKKLDSSKDICPTCEGYGWITKG